MYELNISIGGEIMQKRIIEKTGEQVSLLGFGCMRFPSSNGRIDIAESERIIDLAYKQGVNYFDTAYVYNNGESEKVMGAALKRYKRDSFYVADKLPIWLVQKQEDLQKLFDTSLQRLGMDYIDFYLCHSMDVRNWNMIKKYKVLAFMQKLKAQGKIRHIGFSFHDTPELFDEIANSFDWDFVQIQLNYIDWDVQRAREIYQTIEQKNLPCIVMEPLRGGGLASFSDDVSSVFKQAAPGRTIASWALRWVAEKPRVKVILSGMSSYLQVEDNLNTLSDFVPLSGDENAVLQKAVRLINARPQIGCTGCRYCMPCPKEVDIPKNFAVYNDYMKFSGNKDFQRAYAGDLAAAAAEKCVKCGACVKKCPQHLQIPDELEKVLAIRRVHGA